MKFFPHSRGEQIFDFDAAKIFSSVTIEVAKNQTKEFSTTLQKDHLTVNEDSSWHNKRNHLKIQEK